MTLEGKQFHHYRLLHLIGKGGMGEVYLAEDLSVRRQVAIKVLPLEVEALDQKVVDETQRLVQREATAIASLDHAHILPLYDYGQERIDNQLLAYLIMPYRAEGSLLRWLHRRAQQPHPSQLALAQAAHLIGQAASALQYAHEHHIIHRDVKPANFLIRSRSTSDEFPDLLLTDFGIARLEQATMTTSQVIRGTPAYMAPEQWTTQAEPASDQYALAIMTYELLTGRAPFQGSLTQLMHAHLYEQPQPPSVCNPGLAVTIDAVLLKALAKQPTQRYSSIAAFAQACAAAFAGGDEHTTVRQLASSSLSPVPSDAPAFPGMPGTPDAHPPAARGISPTLPVVPVARPAQLTGIPQITERDMSIDPTPPLRSSGPSAFPKTPHHSRLTLSRRGLLSAGLVLGTGAGAILAVRAFSPHGSSPDLPHGSSSGGRIWTAQHSSTSQDLLGIAWSGTQFVAVGAYGTILTSPDGHTWTAQHSSTSQDLLGIAWSGTQFVAVGGGTVNTAADNTVILTSPDGYTWTPQGTSTSSGLLGIVWSGTQFVAVGYSTILTSPDGSNWTVQEPDASQILFGIAWSGTQFVAVGGNTFVTSPDGSNWTVQNPVLGDLTVLNSLAWSGTQFVAVGSAALPNTGGKTKGRILTSPDGRTWTFQDTVASPGLHGIDWSGQFVVTGDGGTILTSPNGRTWTLRHSGASLPLNSVIWSGTQFVAVGDGGTILTSP